MITLFLDFDGVLHPARAVLGKNGPELRGSGALFMWADGLVTLLAERPHVQVVLSTSWVQHIPFESVRDFRFCRNKEFHIASHTTGSEISSA